MLLGATVCMSSAALLSVSGKDAWGDCTMHKHAQLTGAFRYTNNNTAPSAPCTIWNSIGLSSSYKQLECIQTRGHRCSHATWSWRVCKLLLVNWISNNITSTSQVAWKGVTLYLHLFACCFACRLLYRPQVLQFTQGKVEQAADASCSVHCVFGWGCQSWSPHQGIAGYKFLSF